MKFLFALFATLFFALPAWAVDVQMGANGNLVFEPAEVSIAAGESVHFINNMLPPHNVVVEDHPELSQQQQGQEGSCEHCARALLPFQGLHG